MLDEEQITSRLGCRSVFDFIFYFFPRISLIPAAQFDLCFFFSSPSARFRDPELLEATMLPQVPEIGLKEGSISLMDRNALVEQGSVKQPSDGELTASDQDEAKEDENLVSHYADSL